MTASNALRAATFTSGIGVNVHMEYTDGKYASSSNVIKDLKYLGISLVRDANLNSKNQGQSSYGALASAGIKFDLFVSGNQTMAQTMSELTSFASAHPGAIASIEGPNEINNFPISYSGLTGASAANLLQTNLYSSVSSSGLAGIPVYSYTLGAGGTPLSGYNAAALHPYPPSGAQPLAYLVGAMKDTPAGKSSVFTEFGYSSLASASSGVDQVTQAKETLNGLFDAAKLGVGTTFLYELLDAYADTTTSNAGKHFGLFNLDGTAKPVAVAIHNMMSILADSGSTASTFTTTSLNYTLTGMPSTGESLVLEKSTGAYDLVLWAEPKIWNATTHSEIAAASTNVKVGLGSVYATVEVFDTLQSSTPTEILHNVSSLNVVITDHPIIVEVEGGKINLPVGTFWNDDVHYNASGQGASQVIYGVNGDAMVTTALTYDSSGQIATRSMTLDTHALAAMGGVVTNVADDGHGDSVITYGAQHQTLTILGFTPTQLYEYSSHVL